MRMLLALVALIPLPCLAQENPLTGSTEDVVRLEVGGEVRGRIVKETDDYVEIRVADGMVVGFGKSKTTAILRARARGGLSPASLDRPSPSASPLDLAVTPGAFRTTEQWFALHDGGGTSVGWMHESVRVCEDRSIRFNEEWRFRSAEGPTEITVLECVSPDGQPVSCFYHERVLGPEDRVLTERVVRGVVNNGRLEVTRKSKEGTARYTHPFPSDARFPLEMRALVRRQGPTESVHEGKVYDPRAEEWTRHRYEIGAIRDVDHNGAQIPVRVLTQTGGAPVGGGGVANVEWLDGAGSSVRREVNGPALVAVPRSEGHARAAATPRSAKSASFEVALQPESSGRFALWLPNPLWQAESQRAGEILARCESHDATMSLVLLDQIDADVLLPSAVDTVERWLRLAHADIKFGQRVETRVRDLAGMRMEGRYQVRSLGSVTSRRCDVVVFPSPFGQGFMSFCTDAPISRFASLSGDFARTLKQMELRREDFESPTKGPTARR